MVNKAWSVARVWTPKVGVLVAMFLGSGAWSADLFETGSVLEVVQQIGIDIQIQAPIKQFIGDNEGILTFQNGKLVKEASSLNAEEPHCDINTGIHPAVQNVVKSTSLIKGQIVPVLMAGPDPKSPIAKNINLKGATELLDATVIKTPALKLETIAAANFGKIVQMVEVQCFQVQMDFKVSEINKILGPDAPVVLRPGSKPMKPDTRKATEAKPVAKKLTEAEQAEILAKMADSLMTRVTPVDHFASLPNEVMSLPDTLFLSKSITVSVPSEQILGTLIQEGKRVGVWTVEGIVEDSDGAVDSQLESCLIVVDPAQANNQKTLVVSGGIYGLSNVGKTEDNKFRFWDFRVQAKVTPDSVSVFRLQCPMETSVVDIHNSVLKGLGGLYFISNMPANPMDELQKQIQ